MSAVIMVGAIVLCVTALVVLAGCMWELFR